MQTMTEYTAAYCAARGIARKAPKSTHPNYGVNRYGRQRDTTPVPVSVMANCGCGGICDNCYADNI